MKTIDTRLRFVQKILLIDDDIDDQEIFTYELRHLIQTIQTFTSAKEALKHLQQLRKPFYPSLIVTDFRMPEMSGLEVLKSVKACRPLWHIPVVVYSSNIDGAIEDHLRASGAAGYFQKSLHLEDLKQFLLALDIVQKHSKWSADANGYAIRTVR